MRLSRLEFVSIRWRLALVTAGVTFAVLLLFAIVIGTFTINRIRSDFDDELRSTGADLAERLRIERDPFGEPRIPARDVAGAVVRAAASGNAAARVVNLRGGVVPPSPVLPDLGAPTTEVRDAGPYRVVSTPLFDGFMPLAWLQFGREDRDLNATVARVKVFLGLGVVGGTVLALLAGLGLARRAMAPVWRLTGAAREITRTRDPSLRLPHPPTDDEVADLSRTLEAMLAALDESRGETEAALARQREFVADASHELRTPLTSVLANLELLEASLRGEDRELADSALRSSRRMRRLVSDLLLLAHADARHERPHGPVDLAAVARDAVGEVAPLAPEHEVSVDAPDGDPAVIVDGADDELHRLARNLVENAVSHTPPGTNVRVAVSADGDAALLTVEDDGPGVPPQLRERAFERFVRASGDGGARGGGTGLGLAIVRAVAERHGGSVELADRDGGGARFAVRLPLAPAATRAEARTPA